MSTGPRVQARLGVNLNSRAGVPLLWRDTSAPAASPSLIAGLGGWWDASLAPAGGWTASVSIVPNKLAASPLALSAAGKSRPRLSGDLGGVGLETRGVAGYDASQFAPTLVPTLDPDWRMSSNDLVFGAGGAATIDLVFTRPNLRQNFVSPSSSYFFNGSFIGGISPLISISGVVCLALTSTGMGDSLVAFPNSGSPTTLISTIDPRVTASVRMRGSHASGWDFFLNGTKLNSSLIASGLSSTPVTSPIYFLGNGAGASAQCYFHEALFWPRSLLNTECQTLEVYLSRWVRQSRQAASLILVGQSNADFTFQNTSGFRDFSAGVQYLTGLVSVTVIAQAYPGSSGAGVFPIGGNGVIGDANSYLSGAVTDDPSTMQFIPTGAGALTAACVASLPAYAQKDIAGFLALYSENDTRIRMTQVTAFAATVKRLISLLRAMPHAGPAWDITNTAVFWDSGIPFGDAEGFSAHKLAIQQVISDPLNGASIWLPNGCDGNQNGATYDALTGLYSGGDYLHVDFADDALHAYVGVEPVARKLLAIGRGNTTIPAAFPIAGGPAIASANWEGSTITGNVQTPSVLVTIRHDAGNDLHVPLQAASGLGWVLLDGGIVGVSPVIVARSCVRVSSTTLRVVFSSSPTSPLSSVDLYYVFVTATAGQSSGRLGRGNAVTDNYSDTVARPPAPGMDIAADLGVAYRANRALATTMVPLALG